MTIPHSTRARVFADEWYSRSESGRDRLSLAYLLTQVIQDAAEAATLAERKRIAANLAKLAQP